MELVEKQPGLSAGVMEFLAAWVHTGRRLRQPLKERILAFLESQPDTVARAKFISLVQAGIEDYSPVLGRWRADNSPRSNMFFWLDKTPEQIAVALTAMCLPFYRLRASEFSDKNPGKHLKDLNLRYNSVSKFIAAAILCAAVASKKQGVAALERWIETGHELRQLKNYHMLFALQNALQKHQVDRLSFLFKAISKKHKTIKKDFDELFSTKDRMKLFLQELQTHKGKEPLIPCVFWLHSKATLLQETPLWLEDKSFNTQRITAALNIFADVSLIQEKRYKPLQEDEQILWYLMRLERDDLCSEDELYTLSDAAKKQSARFQIGSQLDPNKGTDRRGSASGSASPARPARRLSMSSKKTETKEKDSIWKRKKSSAGGISTEASVSERSDEASLNDSEDVAKEPPPPVFSLANVMDMAHGEVSGKKDDQILNQMKMW